MYLSTIFICLYFLFPFYFYSTLSQRQILYFLPHYNYLKMVNTSYFVDLVIRRWYIQIVTAGLKMKVLVFRWFTAGKGVFVWVCMHACVCVLVIQCDSVFHQVSVLGGKTIIIIIVLSSLWLSFCYSRRRTKFFDCVLSGEFSWTDNDCREVARYLFF